jgi:hypothetical protein
LKTSEIVTLNNLPSFKLMILGILSQYWRAKYCRKLAQEDGVIGMTVPDNMVQNLWNWLGEGVRKGLELWGREALQHCKWGTMGNSGEDSEGQIANRKADTKLCYKVQMGIRALLGTSLQNM